MLAPRDLQQGSSYALNAVMRGLSRLETAADDLQVGEGGAGGKGTRGQEGCWQGRGGGGIHGKQRMEQQRSNQSS